MNKQIKTIVETDYKNCYFIDLMEEEEFSWENCDLCGSNLGGKRYKVLARKEVK